MLAALDPSGPFPAICGITWTFLCPTAGGAALVSAALCLFQRTTRQALRLSRVGWWAGLLAFAAAILGTVSTAGFKTDPPESVGDAVLMISLTGIAPLLAYFTGRFSRRRMIGVKT
jgi:hypothetical protein